MLKTLLSFVLLLCFFWYFPDIYLWTRNLSNALFQEAANVSTLRVEIKVSQPIPFLPLRYGVLAKGEKNYYVELYSEEQRKVFGISTETGTAVVPAVIADRYVVRVALMREFSSTDLQRSMTYGEPLLAEEELLPTSLSALDVTGDVFAVAVVLPQDNL